MRQITIIAAISKNGIIGNNGKMPWHLPTDLAHFRKLTAGKIVVMGRKTWESLPSKFRPLPNRKNVILSVNENYEAPGGHVISSVENLLEHIVGDLFVIGGSKIYELMMPFTSHLEITRIHHNFEGDTEFPKIDKDWKLRTSTSISRENDLLFNFDSYTK